jgi:hypothetical protein
MDIDVLLLLLFKRFSAVSQTKYIYFSYIFFFLKYDKNTPVSSKLVAIRVYKLKKGKKVNNALATGHEFVRKLL